MIKYFLSFCFLLIINNAATSQDKLSVVVQPTPVLIEVGETNQFLNFDFLVTNNTVDTFVLTKLLLSVFDKNNKLISTRFLDNNGTAPGILTIPNRSLPGPSSKLIFNPFTEFNITAELNYLEYEWTFTNNKDEETMIKTFVSPKKFEQEVNYFFPLKGKFLVYDGHDLYAHHRRFDYEFAPIKGLGITANFMRYAYDFVLLNNNNERYSDKGKNDSDYIGFGKPVYAIGNGKVIYVSKDHQDDKQFNIPAMAGNPLELYGNCIAILHPNNTVSIYGHLKRNSLTVKAGDMVKAQQQIGNIGVSGSSFFPHLHFEIRTSIKASAEGLPSYFWNLYLPGAKTRLRSGLAETGTILEAR